MEDSGDRSSVTDTEAPCPGVHPAATGSSTALAAGGDSRPAHAVVTEGTDTAASAGSGVGPAVAAISDTGAHAGEPHVASSGSSADVKQVPTSLDAAGAQQGAAAAHSLREEGQGASRSLQDGSACIEQAAADEVVAAQAGAAADRGAASGAEPAELVTPGRFIGGGASSAARPEAKAAARLGEAAAKPSPAVQLPSDCEGPEAADAEAGTAVGAGGGPATDEPGAGLIDLQTPGSSSSSSLAPSRIWENNVFSPEVTSRSAQGLVLLRAASAITA